MVAVRLSPRSEEASKSGETKLEVVPTWGRIGVNLDPQISLELDRLTGLSREQLVEYLAESAARVKTLEEKLRGAELENRSPRVAAILSVVETCRRAQISIRHYLSSVLPGLGEFPANRVSELTPANWARSRS